MSDALASSARDESGRGTLVDSVPYLFGGGILGAVAAFFAAMFFGLILALVNAVSGSEVCGAGTNENAIIGMSIFAVVLMLFVGRWLFRVRRSVAVSSDPADFNHSRWLRRRFTAGSMTVYVLLAPAVGLVAIAAANCAGV